MQSKGIDTLILVGQFSTKLLLTASRPAVVSFSHTFRSDGCLAVFNTNSFLPLNIIYLFKNLLF